MATRTNETDADVRVVVSQLTQTTNLARFAVYDCPVGDGIFCDITTLRVGLDCSFEGPFSDLELRGISPRRGHFDTFEVLK